MKTKTTRLFCHPGYEDHIAMMLDTDSGGKVSTAEIQAMIKAYTLAEGMKMYDINIPGTEKGEELMLRVITPVEQPENLPIVMDIHGGNFTAGNVDIDNYRCIALASMTPCIAVSVEYRLASRDLPFPAQLMDCLQAYRWLTKNSESIGGDPSRVALHGTSAGGNLAAALALWLRDHGEQAPALTVLNCPVLTDRITPSKLQFGSLSGIDKYCDSVEAVYMNVQGQYQSYYAMPLYCGNLQGLGPHMIITAEYDPLRDEGLEYARNLMYHSVPCEILSAPRVTHGFCVIDHPLTRYVHRSIAASLRREFGMPITEY
ncbi:MAG: alpha/beta hydrolase [Stomatobaculum sp.]|nr:alpha/beta hydrolase [Stomatobaculum sp.]